MLDRLPILALLALASLPAHSALGADVAATRRTFTVTDFDRIRVDGPYQVTMRTNVAPYARATGAMASIDGVSIKVEGRTLIIRSASGSWGGFADEGRGPVKIEVGTHDLGTAWINGSGALHIDGVKGLSFNLIMQGAGTVRIDHVDVDQMRVGMTGAGTTRIAGRVAQLNASVRGTSSFEADDLKVTDAEIWAEGPSIVRAQVTNSAKIDASGLVSLTLTGSPACTVKARGSANVVGCKQARY